ncbi:MAG: type VI secretion system baseplate subunit TssK [Candidatus Nucleicultricaceae bacterium]
MAVRLRSAVQWHEGMLLRPEHFQQTDRRFEQLMGYHLNNVDPYCWGVKSMQADPASLLTGQYKIIALEAVMPDGCIVNVSVDAGDAPLSVDVKSHTDEIAQAPMYVYLCVPDYMRGAASISNAMPRFISSSVQHVSDENTGDGDEEMPCIKPNAQLVISRTSPDNFVSFPIACLTLDENEIVQARFVPAQLYVRQQEPLGMMLDDIAKRLRSKLAFLNDRVRSRSLELMSAEATNICRSLVAGLLPLEALLKSNKANPFRLYMMLTQVGGFLSGMFPGLMPPPLKAYDHAFCLDNFDELSRYIDGLLDRIQEGYEVYPFDMKDRLYVLNMNPLWMAKKLVIGVKCPPQLSLKQLSEWMETAVIASEPFVESVRDRRTLGASRQIIDGDEEMKLLPAKDILLFEINNDAQVIQPGENLYIFNVSDTPQLRPAEIVLFVSKNRQESFF